MFMDTLQTLFYEEMIKSVSLGFLDLAVINKRIEQGLKSTKIPSAPGGQGGVKKFLATFQKEME